MTCLFLVFWCSQVEPAKQPKVGFGKPIISLQMTPRECSLQNGQWYSWRVIWETNEGHWDREGDCALYGPYPPVEGWQNLKEFRSPYDYHGPAK